MTQPSAANNTGTNKASRQNVFCFGEVLLRMSPQLGAQWIESAQMPVYVGGAELNVATALAQWGIPVKYGTALPENYLASEIKQFIQQKGINTSAIHENGERIGIYYLPQGADLKHAGVIYDRAHSSFAALQPGMIDWEHALEGCHWFHFSAISPALNKNVAEVCKEALEVAKAKKLTISIDLNYRSKLWQYGVNPVDVMPALLQYCQVIMGNVWAAESLLGIPSPIKTSGGRSTDELKEAAEKSMQTLHAHYPEATSLAYTFRLENEYWALLQHGPEQAVSKAFEIGQIVDKVGSGDCFMAGLIDGLLKKKSVQDIIDYAAAAAIGKLQEKGDATRQTAATIEARIQTAITTRKS